MVDRSVSKDGWMAVYRSCSINDLFHHSNEFDSSKNDHQIERINASSSDGYQINKQRKNMFAISNDDEKKTKNCQGIISSQAVTHRFVIFIGY